MDDFTSGKSRIVEIFNFSFKTISNLNITYMTSGFTNHITIDSSKTENIFSYNSGQISRCRKEKKRDDDLASYHEKQQAPQIS